MPITYYTEQEMNELRNEISSLQTQLAQFANITYIEDKAVLFYLRDTTQKLLDKKPSEWKKKFTEDCYELTLQFYEKYGKPL